MELTILGILFLLTTAFIAYNVARMFSDKTDKKIEDLEETIVQLEAAIDKWNEN